MAVELKESKKLKDAISKCQHDLLRLSRYVFSKMHQIFFWSGRNRFLNIKKVNRYNSLNNKTAIHKVNFCIITLQKKFIAYWEKKSSLSLNNNHPTNVQRTRIRATHLSLANPARFHCATTLPSEKTSIFTYFNQIDSF